MGRRKSLIEKENLDVYVPKTLKADVQARLYDPRLGSPAYGAMSTLVTQLLEAWVKSTPLNPITEQVKRKDLEDAIAKL